MNPRRILAASIASLLLSLPLEAATFIWDGGDAVSNLWSAANNWNPNGAPLVATTNDDIVFGGALRLTPDLDANRTINSLTFNNTAGAFTLGSTGGSTLTLGAGGIANNDADTQTIAHALALGAAQTWSATSGALVISGAVDNNGNLLTLAGANAITLSGVIGDTGGLTINSTGTTTISGAIANTYGGTTTVNAGTLILQKTAGVNALAGPVVVGDGAGTDTLQLGASNQIPNTTVTVNSSGVFNLAGASESFLTLNVNGGSVTIGIGSLTLGTSLNMTGGSVSSTGAGALTLQGNLTTTAAAGEATIGGALNLGGATRTFTVADGAAASDLDVTASISNGGINKLGAGTLRLENVNSFAGGLTVTAGTVILTGGGSAGTGTLTLAGGTIASEGGAVTVALPVTLSANSAANEMVFGAAWTLSGNRTLAVDSGTTIIGAAIAGNVTTNTFTKAGAGTLNFAGASANTYTGATTVSAGTLTLTKTTGVTAIAGDLVIGDGAGSDVVNLNASGQIADSASVTIASGGVFNVNADDEIGALIVNAGGSVARTNSLLTVASLQTTGAISITGTGPGALTLKGNVAVSPVGGSQAVITPLVNLNGTRTVTVSDGTAQFEAVIGNFTNGTLVKDGAGGLLLSNQGTTASVTLNAGVLAAAQSVSFGDGTITLNGGTIQANATPLTFSNNVIVNASATFSGLALTTWSGPMTLATPAATLTIGSGGTTVFSGAIAESVVGAGWVKSGIGFLRLSGAGSNTYTGSTTLVEGSLALAKTSGATAIPGDLTIGNGTVSANVQLEGSEQIADTSIVMVSDNGALQFSGASVETIAGLVLAGVDATANVDTGTLGVGSGGVQISGGAISGTGTLALAGDVSSPASNIGIGAISPAVNLTGGARTFDVDNGIASFEVDLSGAVSNGAIVKTGNGALRLSGPAANSFASLVVNEGAVLLGKSAGVNAIGGSATIGDGAGGANADVLRLLAANQLPDTSAIAVGSSGLLELNGFSDTIAELTLAGGAVTTGAGTLTISGGVTSTASASAGTIAGNVALSAPVAVFTIADGSAAIDLDIAAQLTIGGSIEKTGPGALRLGANGATGVVLEGGVLLLASNSSAGTGTIVFANGGGTLQADGAARTIANAISVQAGAPDAGVGGAQNLTVNGAFTMLADARFTKTGSGTLTLAGPRTIAGALMLAGGTLAMPGTTTLPSGASFTQSAGTFSGGTLVNQGAFTFNGGTFNATLQNAGAFVVNGAFFAAGGFTNFSTVTIGTAGGFDANGAGVVNEGTLVLAGGTLQATGAGPVVNNAGIEGTGTIAGSAGFTNNGQLTVSGGNVVLAASANANAGNIDVPAGRQLRLNTALANSGTVALAGGAVASTAALNNNAGGTVRGRGTISVPFTNAGTLRPEGGTINVAQAFTNAGLIDLVDGAALAGGAIANSGRIEGDGTIANAIANTGRIEPHGTLAFGGAVTASASGTIGVSAGSTAFFLTGLATNAGTVALTGGAFDNNGFALNNTGTIAGFGSVFTGGAGLTNNGRVTFAGGFTSVHGAVTNSATRTIEVVNSAAIFHGAVVNNGTFKNTGATITFLGSYTENGTFNSDPADNFFGDLIVGANGALIGGEGDRFFVSGLFDNMSLQSLAWETSAAELIFTAGAHSFTLAGADLGAVPSAFEDNFAWGTLHLAAGAGLTLGDGNATPGAALYASVIDLDGGLAQLASITGNGINIYYDPALAENAYLGDAIHPFTGGGALVPVPEPGSLALLLAAAPVLGWRRFRH